jgi:hypothetical protein
VTTRASKSTSRSSTSGASRFKRAITFASVFDFAIGTSRRTEIVIVLACATAEAVASGATSASCYDAREYVFVVSVVVSESELGNIQREIVLAYLVIAAHDAALEERPERFDIVGVDIPAHIFVRLVIDRAVRERLIEFLIARAFIGRDQINLVRDGLANETRQRVSARIFDHFADDVAFAADSSDDCRLVHWAASALLLFPVAIFVLTTDVSLVYSNLPHQLKELVIFHRSADARAHIPHGFVTGFIVEDRPLDLQSAHPFLALAHQEHDLEPHAQLVVCILKNRPTDDGESIAVALVAGNNFACLRVDRLSTALTNPVEGPMRDVEDLLVAAARASDAVGPTLGDQIGLAGFFVRELCQKFGERHGEILS